MRPEGACATAQKVTPRILPVNQETGTATGTALRRTLYDLDADLNELNNVAEEASYGGARNDLRKRLAGWMKETGDPLLDGPIASPTYYQMRDMLFG